MDGGVMLINLTIKQKKLRLIEEIMAKDSDDLCRRVLRNGVKECNGEALLTECRKLSKELGKTDVTIEFFHKEISRQADWRVLGPLTSYFHWKYYL